MVPQLAQGFLQPRIRGRTGKPQRLQVEVEVGVRGGGEEGDVPAALLSRILSDVSSNPIRPGKEWVGEPFDSDGSIESVATVHHGRVG